jgi:hypothetical protein
MNYKEETSRLLAIRKAATRGPWKRRNGRGEYECFVEGPKVPGVPYSAEILGDDYGSFGDDEQRARDVDFVASAHEMADHLERLQATIDGDIDRL